MKNLINTADIYTLGIKILRNAALITKPVITLFQNKLLEQSIYEGYTFNEIKDMVYNNGLKFKTSDHKGFEAKTIRARVERQIESVWNKSGNPAKIRNAHIPQKLVDYILRRYIKEFLVIEVLPSSDYNDLQNPVYYKNSDINTARVANIVSDGVGF